MPKVTTFPQWPITKVRFPRALCRAASRRFFGSDHQNHVGAQSLLESRRIRNLPIFVDLNLGNPVGEKLIWLLTWQWSLYKIPDTGKLQLCSVFDIMFWCQFISDLIYKATIRICFRTHPPPPPPNSHLNSGIQQGLWGAKARTPQLRSMQPWHLIMLKLVTFSRLTRRQEFILTFSSRQESNGANAMGWLSILISALGHFALRPLYAQPELIVNLLSALSQALPALGVLHTNTICSLFFHLPFLCIEVEDRYFSLCSLKWTWISSSAVRAVLYGLHCPHSPLIRNHFTAISSEFFIQSVAFCENRGQLKSGVSACTCRKKL